MSCGRTALLLFMKTSGQSAEGNRRRKKSLRRTSKSLPLNKQRTPEIFTKVTQKPSHTSGQFFSLHDSCFHLFSLQTQTGDVKFEIWHKFRFITLIFIYLTLPTLHLLKQKKDLGFCSNICYTLFLHLLRTLTTARYVFETNIVLANSGKGKKRRDVC